MSNTLNNLSEKVADLLIGIGAININVKNPFKFSSGVLSPIYIDNRLIMSFPDERDKIIEYYVELIKEKVGLDEFEVVSGTAVGAIPMASWVSQKLHLPMIFVRKEAKDHGKGNKVEGVLKKGQKVLIIEDHISTGESSIINALAVREAGGIVKYVVSTTTYNFNSAVENFRKTNLHDFSLTEAESILKVALGKKIIKSSELEVINNWVSSPALWGKKYFASS